MPDSLKRHLIVGLGSIGKRHAGILLEKGYDVLGVDPYHQSGAEFKVLDSLKAGLDLDPDMVWLCTPTELHADQACAVIESGCHLFIEKPVAHTPEKAEKILQCFQIQKKKGLVWVGCNMRFHPAVVKIKTILESGLIGKPLISRIHFSHWLPNMRPGTDYRDNYAAGKEGGGIILDDIHDIDIALWLSGPVKKVTGLSSKSGILDIAAEDMAVFNIVHENNSLSIVHMDFLRKDKSRGIEITGEKGTIEWRSHGKNPEKAKIAFYSPQNEEPEILYTEKIYNYNSMFECQLNRIQTRIETGKGFGISLIEACEALKTAYIVKRNQA